MLKFFSILAVLAATALSAAAQSVPRLYGVRVYSEPAAPPALISLPVDDVLTLTEELDLSAIIGESVMEAGTIRGAACDGKTYYMLVSEDGMMPYRLVAVDIASKKAKEVRNYYGEANPIASIIVSDITYNPADGKIYGVGYDLASAEIVGDEVDAQVALFVIDPDSGDSEILGLQDFTAFCAITFNKYGDLMGVDSYGNLWSINARNGKPADHVESTGIQPVGTQSMATDPVTGDMYWAAYTADGSTPSCNLVKISMTEDWMFEVNNLGQVANATELVGLYVDPEPISDKAPASPESFEVAVSGNGIKSASLSWVNPSVTRAGTPLSEFSVNIYADDVKVTTISGCEAGKAASYEYVATESGPVTFSVAASNDAGEGARTFADQVYIGEDVPAAVANLTAKRPDPEKYDITISWEAPETGAQGGWINAAALKYKVVRRSDGKVIADALQSTSVTDSDITATGAYIYDVTPFTEAGLGVTSATAPCISGPAINPPYTMNLSNLEDANLWTVENTDGDDYLWTLLDKWGGNDTSFRYYPVEIVGGVQPTDDWLISPSFHLEAGKYYAMSYDLRLWGELFPATYTVNIGQGYRPSALTRVLESRERVVNDLMWENRSISFDVAETGDYNIGFHVTLANPMEVKGVNLREIAKLDLSATTLKGTVGASVGEPVDYAVSVLNGGFEPVSGYTVRLEDAEGNILASRTVEEPLASMASTTIDVTWTPEEAGAYKVRASVVAEGDLVADNNYTEPLDVSVFPGGDWHAITDGKTFTAFAPFVLRYKHSGAQTIYTSEEMGGKPAKILGIEYYYMPMGTAAQASFHGSISMANTQITDFEGFEPLGAEEFTTVYEGDFILDPAYNKVTVVFSTPFEYTGNNLCVLTQHDSETTANMLFHALSPKNGTKVTAVFYSDTDQYDFTDAGGCLADRPNISLLMTAGSGVEAVGSAAGKTTVVYDRANKKLILDKESTVRIVSLQGVVLLDTKGTVIDVSAFSGPAIVVASDTTAKVIF